MTPSRLRPRYWARSLRARLIAFLTIALLPLGAIAVLQTVQVMREANRLTERDVLARTERAASEQGAILRHALGASDALGIAASTLRDDPDACSRIMSDFVAVQPDFIFAGFVPRDGMMVCNSAGVTIDYAGRADWEEFVANPVPSITVNRNGDATGTSVFIAFAPIFDKDRITLLGGQAVSIPHGLAEAFLASALENVDIALIDPQGEVLGSSTGMDSVDAFGQLNIMPSEMTIPRQGQLLRAGDITGMDLPAAIVPLIPDRIYAVGLWRDGETLQSVSLFGRAVPLFPLLMWLAGLAVAYITVNNLVLRHLSRLTHRMEEYRSGENLPDFALASDAPAELQDIADSYNELVMRVSVDQATLEDSLREKDLLLREIHHRVKNNLQLIASILNMQMRGVKDPAAKRVLKRVHDRVMSLSSIHHALYSDTMLDRVRVDALMGEVVSAVSDIAFSGALRVKTESILDPVSLDPDQAVPLLLLATEAMTNAAKYVGAPVGASPRIVVTLSETDAGEVSLRVVNTRGPETLEAVDEAGDGSGLGARLIEAFASQLGGVIEIDMAEHTFDLMVKFQNQPSL